MCPGCVNKRARNSPKESMPTGEKEMALRATAPALMNLENLPAPIPESVAPDMLQLPGLQANEYPFANLFKFGPEYSGFIMNGIELPSLPANEHAFDNEPTSYQDFSNFTNESEVPGLPVNNHAFTNEPNSSHESTELTISQPEFPGVPVDEQVLSNQQNLDLESDVDFSQFIKTDSEYPVLPANEQAPTDEQAPTNEQTYASNFGQCIDSGFNNDLPSSSDSPDTLDSADPPEWSLEMKLHDRLTSFLT
jgi:hypothetical protein